MTLRGRTSWRTVVAAAFALAMVGQPAFGDYLQAGVDAARTGATTDAGPPKSEIALVKPLPAGSSDSSHVSAHLIIGRNVYIAVQPVEIPEDARVTRGIWRVNVDNGEAVRFIGLDGYIDGLAADGERIFVISQGKLSAYSLDTATHAWDWPFPALFPVFRDFCWDPAVADGHVFIACSEVERNDAATGTLLQDGSTIVKAHLFAASIDATTGIQDWVWVKNLSAERNPDGGPDGEAEVSNQYASQSQPDGMAIVGDSMLIVTFENGMPENPQSRWSIGRSMPGRAPISGIGLPESAQTRNPRRLQATPTRSTAWLPFPRGGRRPLMPSLATSFSESMLLHSEKRSASRFRDPMTATEGYRISRSRGAAFTWHPNTPCTQ